MPTSQPLPIVFALTSLIDRLFEALAARCGRFPVGGPLLLFLWRRFETMKTRFARLAARVAAGKIVGPRAPRKSGARRPPADRTESEPRFRIGKFVRPEFGWLTGVLARLSGPSEDFSGQLRSLVTGDPEMLALLVATPAAARILSPLCRMLGVDPALLVPAGGGPSAPTPTTATDPTTFAPRATRADAPGAGTDIAPPLKTPGVARGPRIVPRWDLGVVERRGR